MLAMTDAGELRFGVIVPRVAGRGAEDGRARSTQDPHARTSCPRSPQRFRRWIVGGSSGAFLGGVGALEEMWEPWCKAISTANCLGSMR